MLSSAPCSWRYMQHVPAHALVPAVTNVCPGEAGKGSGVDDTGGGQVCLAEKGWKGFQAEAQLEQGCRGEAAGVGGQFVGAACQELWQLFEGWDH